LLNPIPEKTLLVVIGLLCKNRIYFIGSIAFFFRCYDEVVIIERLESIYSKEMVTARTVAAFVMKRVLFLYIYSGFKEKLNCFLKQCSRLKTCNLLGCYTIKNLIISIKIANKRYKMR
jgi:hypothetical protein